MFWLMNPFHQILFVSMKNNGKELIKDAALWAIVFGALTLLVVYNYAEVNEILNHKFN